MALIVLTVPVLCWIVIWGCYGFRFDPSRDDSFAFSWNHPGVADGLIGKAIELARDACLLPEAYLNGFSLMQQDSVGRKAYALGRITTGGWWWYFPFAFLVKTPFPTVVLIGWGLWSWARKPVGERVNTEFLLPPLILYGVTAVSSMFNIGIRHLLPVYPLLFTLAGAIDVGGEGKRAAWLRRGALALLAGTMIETGSQAPYFLAFFNAPARVVWERQEMLVDSNLDWGQDLGRLKAYMDRHGIREVKLAYFGSASPRHLNLAHRLLPSFRHYVWFEPEWKEASELQSGDYVAIGATSLVGVLDDQDRPFLRRLRAMKPLTVIGNSVFLYRIP